VDDGVATGVTARAALRAVRERSPRRVVLAVPVCSPEAADAFDVELICPRRPADFRAVGRWYTHFDQVTDDEVLALLGERGGTSR
jgi:putative phosphoribosyl transferase